MTGAGRHLAHSKQKRQANPVWFKTPMNKTLKFIEGYQRDQISKIEVRWSKGKDENENFRNEVIEECANRKKDSDFELIKDLLNESSKWSQKSFVINHNFTDLSELFFRLSNGRCFYEYLMILDRTMDTYLGGLNFKIKKCEFDRISENIKLEASKEPDEKRKQIMFKGLGLIEEEIVIP